jgi:hypothetical protein
MEKSISFRNSYTAKRKLEVIEYAENNGNRAAARHFGCNEASVREWRKSKSVIQKMPSDKRCLRRGSVKSTELEQKLKSWIVEKRKQSLKVSTVMIGIQAKLLAPDFGVENFNGSANWVYRFMKRNRLGVRMVTTKGQPLPHDWEAKIESFHQFVREKKVGIELNQIGKFKLE